MVMPVLNKSNKIEFEDNELTQLAESIAMDFADIDNENVPGIEYIESLVQTSNFYDYTLKNAKKIGFDKATKEELIDFLNNRCITKNIFFSKSPSENKKTLKRWLIKNCIPTKRNEIYKLCFALDMDTTTTTEFFLKGCFERPFNCKDIDEATYFFCMSNNLTYTDALDIIEEINIKNTSNANEDIVETENVRSVIQKIDSRKKFIGYMVENSWIQNQTGCEKVLHLIDICKNYATAENNKIGICEELKSISSIDDMLAVIYGYRARLMEDGKEIYKKTISKSNFPPSIKQNFPQAKQLQSIENKTASYDVIRKALIMLYFYYFYSELFYPDPKRTKNAISEYKNPKYMFDEFQNSLNVELSKCGYVQLYWRNPYDWMFGYCAMHESPVDCLRDIIYELYLDEDDEEKFK